MELFLIFFPFFVLSFVRPCSSQCNIPSKYWCDNDDVAKQCEVFDQCQKLRSIKGKNAPLVDFALYYESLCPDCKDFFAQNLGPAFAKISSIMNLTLVPYGNAEEIQIGDKWKFNCQHGPPECTGNIIETCAINIVNNITAYFPFLLCMEASGYDPVNAAKSCSRKYPVPLEDILTCSTSAKGNQMEHEMALKTMSLKPRHEYVPWVVLNGVHTNAIQKEAENNLIKLICSTYTGQSKPAACQNA